MVYHKPQDFRAESNLVINPDQKQSTRANNSISTGSTEFTYSAVCNLHSTKFSFEVAKLRNISKCTSCHGEASISPFNRSSSRSWRTWSPGLYTRVEDHENCWIPNFHWRWLICLTFANYGCSGEWTVFESHELLTNHHLNNLYKKRSEKRVCLGAWEQCILQTFLGGHTSRIRSPRTMFSNLGSWKWKAF